MTYEPIAERDWPAFFESFSKHLEGRRVEIEVIGLDLGVQIEAEWLPLRSLRYAPEPPSIRAEVVSEHPFDHVVEAPAAVWAEIAGGELSSLVVEDARGTKEIFRFRSPLELPGRAIGGEARI